MGLRLDVPLRNSGKWRRRKDRNDTRQGDSYGGATMEVEGNEGEKENICCPYKEEQKEWGTKRKDVEVISVIQIAAEGWNQNKKLRGETKGS